MPTPSPDPQPTTTPDDGGASIGHLCSVVLPFDPALSTEQTDALWLRLPTTAGVVLFEDEHSRPLLIRPIGDPRAFVRRRFEPDPPAETGAPRTDYRAIVRCIRVAPTGHTLLAELLGAIMEASLDPAVAESTAARLGGSVVLCDPSARLPRFTPVELTDLWRAGTTLTRHHRVIGPFASTKRAQRWIETVIDLFDLCRYDHLLAQTPHAVACVYKQMGKCPAPCDGSEPIESYRERFGRASRFFGDPLASEIDRCRRDMESAASDLDFERAAALKERLSAMQSLITGGDWPVGDVLATRWLLTGTGERPRWSRMSTLDPGGLRILADWKTDTPPPVVDPDGSPPLAAGRIGWLLMAVLVESHRRSLASGESAQPCVRERAAIP
jgi:hypothetical protein